MSKILFIPAVALSLITALPAGAQDSTEARTARIKAHTERIQTLIKESQERREAEQRRAEASIPADAATTKSKAVSKPESITASATSLQQDRERAEGWRQYWEFYQTPFDARRTEVLRGFEQSFSNDVISLKWNLGSAEDEISLNARNLKTGRLVESSTSAPLRTITYDWMRTSGTVTTLNLLPEGGKLMLGNSSNIMTIEYGRSGYPQVTLEQWIQRPTLHLASDITAPRSNAATKVDLDSVVQGYARSKRSFEIVVTKDFNQVVNDWVIFLKDNKVYAQELETTTSILVGENKDDSRPVGTMNLRIYNRDQITSSVSVEVAGCWYPHTLFATDKTANIKKIVDKSGWPYATTFDVLNALGKAYGFEVDWADEATREVAQKQITDESVWDSGQVESVLQRIEMFLGEDFAPAAKGPSRLRVELSDKYQARQELKELTQKLKQDFPLETKIYRVNKLTANQAIAILKRDFLGCYIIGTPATSDVTSNTLALQGMYWSILKRPLDEENDLRKQMAARTDGASVIVCESIDNGNMTVRNEEGEAILISATGATHDRIAAWLKNIESEVKEVAIGGSPDSAVPERRRLQVVLLQGGKAGQLAAVADESGTTVTYQAEVPAQYGMTPDDLKLLGFDGAVVTGRGVVDLVAKPGKTGEAKITLGGSYTFSAQYQQEQGGFLVIDGTLEKSDENGKPLAQNTMMLEVGKPAYLGVTNLSGAVIVVVSWVNGQ